VIKRLETYAWENQLSDPAQITAAVTQALDLLRRFKSSAVRAEIEGAAQVYRELPFVHRLEGRTIHGVIDVLYFDGREWHVVDYKTALVSRHKAAENAKRYYLQVGVYARAVEALTGQIPHTALYYIYPGWRVFVKPADWQPALDCLDDDLQAALAGE